MIRKHCKRCASNMPLILFNVGAKNFIPSPKDSVQIPQKMSWPNALCNKTCECHDYFRFKYLISYNKIHFAIFHLVTYFAFQIFCLPYSSNMQAGFLLRMEIVNGKCQQQVTHNKKNFIHVPYR